MVFASLSERTDRADQPHQPQTALDLIPATAYTLDTLPFNKKGALVKRTVALMWILLFWLGFVVAPIAQTRLGLKMSGELRVVTNGVLTGVKVKNSFFRRTDQVDPKLAIEVSGGVNDIVTNIVSTTNIVVTNSVTNEVITVVTNVVTNVVTDTIAILTIDEDGTENALFEFSDVTTLETVDARQRFLAFGQGCGLLGDLCPSNFLGEVQFNDAVLSGAILFTESNTARNVFATIFFRGESDAGTVLFEGKLTGNNPLPP